jgi:hypothetical protein
MDEEPLCGSGIERSKPLGCIYDTYGILFQDRAMDISKDGMIWQFSLKIHRCERCGKK